jgi:hypothetical protein
MPFSKLLALNLISTSIKVMRTSKITDTKRYDSSMTTLVFKVPTSTIINTLDYNSFLIFIDLDLLSNARGAKFDLLQASQGYNKFKIIKQKH